MCVGGMQANTDNEIDKNILFPKNELKESIRYDF